jgi:hypothetical protein
MVIPTDVYDKDGNILRIEFYDLDGEFVVQALWDENDEQTGKNRIKFREWAYHMVEQIGEEVIK